ncbi:MAG: hypothetical protein H7Y15_06340 [Pseudonocardia sp.]|nr:hypothetical protein [Pseudonocardia sp.]
MTDGRPGWVRDVEPPRSLDELRGPTSGVVRLPLRIYWSGPDPESVEWDSGTPDRRARLYEIEPPSATSFSTGARLTP